MKNKSAFKLSGLSGLLVGAVILACLYLTSLYSYLLFHSLVELFSVFVFTTIFIIAWSSRALFQNYYFLFVGAAFLFVAVIELAHALSYQGMGIFEGYGTNLATQLWLAARYLESLALLIAPLFLGRKVNNSKVLWVFGAVTVLLLLSIFYWRIFPAAYIEGQGLTLFKIVSEGVISLLLLGSIFLLVKQRRALPGSSVRLIVAAISFQIAAELAFTLYTDPYGLSNMAGHLLFIVSLFLFYRALVDIPMRHSADLLALQARYQAIVDNMWGGVLILDTQGIIYTNARASKILGIPPEQLAGRPLTDFICPDGRSGLQEALADLARHNQGTSSHMECLVEYGDGRRGRINCHFTNLKTNSKGPQILAILNDITERKEIETKLGQLYQNELQLRHQIEEEMERRNEFSRALVHELKTPLTPIIASIEYLTAHFKREPWKSLLRNISNGATTLNHRIDELMELSRLERGSVKLNMGRVDLPLLIGDITEYMTPLLNGRQQTLRTDVAPGLPVIRADGDRLKQVLMNLVTNAYKYTPPGKEIAIRVRQETDNIIVEVQGKGRGIPLEMQKRLFEPYYQVKSDPENPGGLGLGLSISKSLVELHGGKIWLESRPGRGSTFSFSLPALPAETVEESEVSAGEDDDKNTGG